MYRKARVNRCLPRIETCEPRMMLSGAAAATHVRLGTGLTGEYFAGSDLSQAVQVENDPQINLAGQHGLPKELQGSGGFSVRWTGQVEAAASGTYTFKTTTFGGVQLLVAGQLIIDDSTAQGRAQNSGTIALVAGEKYDIEMEYVFNGKGTALARLQWSSAGRALLVVPRTSLFPDPSATMPVSAGLLGQYYEGANFRQLVLTRSDPTINFSWGGGTPSPAVPSAPFSVRWTGEIETQFSEAYTFYTVSDDGTRVSVNGQLIINDWSSHSLLLQEGTISLQAGTPYDIEVDYFANAIPPSTVKFSWSSAHTPLQIVPQSAFVEGATAGTVQATATTPGEIDLSWDGSAAASGYVVERSPDGTTGWTQIGTTASGVTSYADTGLAPATAYFYRVSATDSAGGVSSPSSPVSATTLQSPPATPTGATATASSSSQIIIAWNAVTGATGYLIDRSPDGSSNWATVGTTTGSATSFADTALSAATTYFYRVTAMNAGGASSPTAPVSTTTLVAPPASPANLTVTTTSDTLINLTWADVAGESGFTVESSPDGINNWAVTTTVPEGDTSLSIGGLTGSTTYYYRVLATNAGGSSAPSNIVSVTTEAPVPGYASFTTLFGVTDNSTPGVYSIDTSTGNAIQIGSLLFPTSAAARDPVTGKLYYISDAVANVQIATWDPLASAASADAVVSNGAPVSNGVTRAAFSSSGILYFTAGAGDLYAYNTTSNTATLLGTIETAAGVLPAVDGDMAFGPDGNLYVQTGGIMYEVTSVAIATAGGSGSTIAATQIGADGVGNLQIAFGQNGVLYGDDSNGQIYTVNLVTGAATIVPGSTPSGHGMDDLAGVPLFADLTVTQTASVLSKGADGTYSISVVNNGLNTNVSEVVVTDTLPAGVSFVSAAGTGWTVTQLGQVITMTYAGNVPVGTTLPIMTLRVAVGDSVPANVVNTAVVSSTIFDQDAAGSSSVLSTPVES